MTRLEVVGAEDADMIIKLYEKMGRKVVCDYSEGKYVIIVEGEQNENRTDK